MQRLTSILLILLIATTPVWAIEKNTASQKITLYAYDSSTNAPKTGDAANITAYVSKDNGAPAVLTDTSATEVSSTNAPGEYTFDLTQGETNGNDLLFTGKSTTSNVVIQRQLMTTTDVEAQVTSAFTQLGTPEFATLAESVWGYNLDGVFGGGEAGEKIQLILDDTGTSGVKISSGTGLGQLSISSGLLAWNPAWDAEAQSEAQDAISSLFQLAGGVVQSNCVQISGDPNAADNAELMFDGTGYAGGTTKLGVNAVQWLGTALATPDTAGYPKVTMKNGTGTGEMSITSGVVNSRLISSGSGSITSSTFASGAIMLETDVLDVVNEALADPDNLTAIASSVVDLDLSTGHSVAGSLAVLSNSTYDVTAKLDDTVEDPGSGTYRFTSTSLAESPVGSGGGLDAAGVRAALGLDQADLQVRLDDINSQVTTSITVSGELGDSLGLVADDVDAILVDTGTTIPAALGDLELSGGGQPISPRYEIEGHVWRFSQSGQLTGRPNITEQGEFDGLLVMDFDTIIPKTTSILTAELAESPGVGITVDDPLMLSPNKRAVHIVAASSTDGTYTFVVKVTTTDGQSFQRIGIFKLRGN